MATQPSLSERIGSLFQPAILLSWAIKYYLIVLYEEVFQKHKYLSLLNPSSIRTKAFPRFWLFLNAPRDDAPSGGSFDLIPPLLATASGVILDVGPGSGTQMPLFARTDSSSTSPSITVIYGAEPCVGLHAELEARARMEGLGDKFRILACGAESDSLLPALENEGLFKGREKSDAEYNGHPVFDTIVCIRVLCSVPQVRETLEGLCMLLKPGGRMLVCEHVINPWRRNGSLVARMLQWVYMKAGWSYFVGDCCLDRDLKTELLQAARNDGGWGKVELEEHFLWSSMPYVSGTLTRKL